MTKNYWVLGDQLLGPLRNLGVLSFLASTQSSDDLSVAILVFTTAQMCGAFVVASMGEPTLLAPSNWIHRGGAAWARSRISILAALSATATIGIGAITSLADTAVLSLGAVGLVTCWHDSIRAVEIRRLAQWPAIRNLLLTAVIWACAMFSSPMSWTWLTISVLLCGLGVIDGVGFADCLEKRDSRGQCTARPPPASWMLVFRMVRTPSNAADFGC